MQPLLYQHQLFFNDFCSLSMNEAQITGDIQLLQSGSSFFDALIKSIDSAIEEIHFQTYIFEKDETGLQVAAALLRAASRGVKIYLLLDAYGSGRLPKDFIRELRTAGIQLKFYGPIFARGSFHIGRRLHRKVIVFDKKTAIVTGINISDNYNKTNRLTPWLDFAVIVEGTVAYRLRSICLQRWQKKPFRRMPKAEKVHLPLTNKITVRQNDWLRRLRQVSSTYKNQIRRSRHSLLFVGGYFFPGGYIRKLLKRAIERGVSIRIILAAESDVPLQRNAVEYLYQWMLRNGIRIYEYIPSNVHGKVLIADKKFVSLGSYDLNNLSNFSNIELNLDIDDEKFAASFLQHIEKIIAADCRLITKEELYKRSNLWKRFKHWISYQIVKTLFVLAFWLSNKEDDYQ
jgi:cardiolipin synthase A/B